MAIKGLTDRGASFPRIGELRKGAEKPQTGNMPGKDLDYFRFTSDDDDAVKAFEEAYGKQPRAIRCYLPYKDVESNFGTYMEEWLAGGLVRRCNGETIEIERTVKGYDKVPHACKKGTPGGCKCKQVGRLTIVVPELRRFAYVVALTTSIHDIIELHGNLTAAMEIRGDLRGIPFILSRKPREISMPGSDGKRVRREKWLLSIEPAPTWVQTQIDQLPSFEEPAQLPAPDEDGVIESTGTSEPPKAEPQKSTQSPVEQKPPATETKADPLDALINESQKLIDKPPETWKRSAIDIIQNNWTKLYELARNEGAQLVIAVKADAKPGEYLKAIVDQGALLKQFRADVAAAEQISKADDISEWTGETATK